MNNSVSPTQFYKYFSAETAIEHILGRSTIKWSSPFEFNDPFDNQYELHMEPVTDELIEEMVSLWQNDPNLDYLQVNVGSISIPGNIFSKLAKLLPKSELEQGVKEGIIRVDSALPNFKSRFMAEMSKTAIFCLTESHTNLLMWAHYADEHKGVAIAFSAKDSDSPLPLAKRVQYSLEVPRLRYQDLMFDPYEKIKSIMEMFYLTKSLEWEYEKEWRIISAGGGGIRPYPIEEVDAIYLGCRISVEHKEKILEIAQTKYPKALIYEATKSPTCFALEFTQIH